MLPQCLLLTVSTELLVCRLLHLPQVLPLVRRLNPSSRDGTAHAERVSADREQRSYRVLPVMQRRALPVRLCKRRS